MAIRSIRRRLRDGARVLLVFTVVGVVFLGMLWALQRHLIYHPDRGGVAPADQIIDGAQDVTLRTSDGLRLGAWLVPAGQRASGVTVLVGNGNAGDRSLRAPLARALAARGLSVLLFDYRGYGGNPGTPSEAGLARDVRAAYRYLTARNDDRIIYYGESLGSAVVTELAAEHPPAALVLRSPFPDLASVGQVHYPYLPVRTLLRDRYELARHLRRVHVPTLVVYGTADTIVPPALSRTVAKAAPGPTTVVAVAGADHNDPALLDGPDLVTAVDALDE